MDLENAFFIIDGSSYIYRAFYALGRLTSPSGMPTQAIYGFAQMLLKVLREKNPPYLCVVFDPPGPTFRHDIYPSYKATRQRMPEDLVVQIPFIKDFVRLWGITQLEREGYEADDVIAALSRFARARDCRVVIVSGDKDLHQLIEDSAVVQWDPQKDKVFMEREVMERYGVTSRQFRDFLALVGDSSDNVPGVKGVGEKSAQQLMQRWESLDGIYAHIDAVAPQSVKKKLRDHRDAAFLSKRLVSLKDDVPLDFSLEDFTPGSPARADLMRFCREQGFKSLLESLSQQWGEDIEEVSPSRADRRMMEIRVIEEAEGLEALVRHMARNSPFSIHVDTSSFDPMQSHIRGIALCCEEDRASYVPLTSAAPDDMPGRVRKGILNLKALEPLLTGKEMKKAGHNLKHDTVALMRHGMRLEGMVFDSMVGSYLLDPARGSHTIERIVEDILGESISAPVESRNRAKSSRKDAAGVDSRYSMEAACARAEAAWRLMPLIRHKLEETGQEFLFDSLEMPLISILAGMEHRGILVDAHHLRDLTVQFEEALQEKASTIYALAEEEFNIQSPRQLASILFEKLELPVIRKTKTGPSTDMSVLEELAPHHPIVEQVIAYRSLAKLKGTYADALPALIHPDTGRIHTSYNQTVTATGRLSSSEPNLQNIPIRTEEGRRIRRAFIAAPGHVLLSADYSQIELRILAHFSEDRHLVEAFQTGADVHLRTAAEMLNVPAHEVTPEMRRQAKTINFGIIYGMGPYGLAQRLRITSKLAKAAIEKYFEHYVGVRRFINECIEKARRQGYTETLLGRRRQIPELQSRNFNVRQQGERLAINTPIQGTAADLIKKAMIDVQGRLDAAGFRAAMLLQVHDELVFEVPEGELETVRNLVKEAMEAVWPLKVPLMVDMGTGQNWTEAHP